MPEEVTEEDLVREYRRTHPRSRAVRIIAYDLNTSRRKSERCILCGATGPTWAAQWPKTKAAEQWADEHRRLHLEGESEGEA